MKTKIFAFLIFLFTIAAPATAVTIPEIDPALISELETVAKGHAFWVGIHFKLPGKWHIYWKNPGDKEIAKEKEHTGRFK